MSQLAEIVFLKWFQHQRSNNVPISGSIVQVKAENLNELYIGCIGLSIAIFMVVKFMTNVNLKKTAT